MNQDIFSKILISFMVFTLFASVYVFTEKGQQSTAQQIPAAVQVEKEKVKSSSTKINSLKPKILKNNYYAPSGKAELIRQAAKNMGKDDPFAGDNSIAMPSSEGLKLPSGINNNIKIGNFLPMPPSIDGSSLPTISNISGIGNNPSVRPDNFELVKLKGFIGNKVIVEVDNNTEALSLNQSFRGAKVLSIDSTNMSAKFKKNGKIITKKIDFPSNKTLKLISKNI